MDISVIYQKISLVLLGLTTWEIIVQLPFDWSIISRKVRCSFFYLVKQNNLMSAHAPPDISNVAMKQREAHWPVFFYFLCKYSLWSAVISANVATNVTTKVNCQGLVCASSFIGFFSHSETTRSTRSFNLQSPLPHLPDQHYSCYALLQSGIVLVS